MPTKSVSQKVQTAVGAVLLAPAPQIAAGEAAEHRRPARLAALALQGQEDLLDRIGHRDRLPLAPARPARSSQAGQSPQP